MAVIWVLANLQGVTEMRRGNRKTERREEGWRHRGERMRKERKREEQGAIEARDLTAGQKIDYR